MNSFTIRAGAADYARANGRLSVGLHFDFGEWVCRNGNWEPRYLLEQTREEAIRQLNAFRELMAVDPTHLDSHQHTHLREPLCSLLQDMARTLNVPLRHFTPDVAYRGDFYGQLDEGAPYPEGISVAHLVKIFHGLDNGVTELSCHPGWATGLDSAYSGEREDELRTLCDSRVLSAVRDRDIELISFRKLVRWA